MSPGGAKRKLDVRFFLWGLFLLQISLICLFLLFGSLLVSTAIDTEDATDGRAQTAEFRQQEQQQPLEGNVHHRIATPSIGGVWSPFGVRFIANRTVGLATDGPRHPDGIALSNDVALGVENDGGNQLLKNKLLHPRHPKYHPWIQRDIPKAESAEKYFRTISYTDWQGIRKRRLCFVEGTQGKALVTSKATSKAGNNETEQIDTGIRRPESVAGSTGTETKANELSKNSPPATDDVLSADDGSAVTVGDDGTGRCRCNPQWHGTDCGQPEVIWRAFITSKIPPRDQTAIPRRYARNLFYIVQSTFISVEVLEIQLMELADQVALFVLCDRPVGVPGSASYGASIAHHADGTDFLRTIRNRLLIVSDATCSGRNMFRKLLKYTKKGAIHADDIVLFSGTDEILNRKAVAYLRWYDNWPQPVRFRLKHNVYGFFWQHPGNSTVIGSAAVQMSTLREVYGSDPDRLLAIEKPVMLIGDLNHFGGWYCRRCYQPGSIVQYYEHRAASTGVSAKDALYLPDPKRTKVLNEEYVQQLIATGKDLEDGERSLERLSRRTDKYYQPEYVRENSWKFDNIVLNLFARWDDNLADDDYFS
ncbi:beta-1,4-mannosyl-glycoprotein 4-beta-N-acetylglucosaminyltransferase [Anopheles marshallii]|uniref:beta-1,4-mannosyl-glycoprotein 4-beta-N-acetylglucosaminyltransferase n=1 Tax=Anopheles marshallii TaxID=1521116 RepID=UPI00237A79A5|nr:beta-1,4-mannosyl-glycoprotein 4-beta-N-acetylglucosaminyltransferase [Anopheles marshallii]